ncbi:hypothetical protein F5141DRAFT_1190091 [Pisolithus sp. B1]|nr:hypothetical protein F5141DRAFT_1190091 [Pisolithus sp. B1]
MASETRRKVKTQSASPIGPSGIEAALEAKANPSIQPRPRIFDEFAVTDRPIALCEAGVRVVYCLDLPEEPSEVKQRRSDDKEQRLDICVAAAGISKPPMDCLEYSAETFKEVIDVDTAGVFFTAQAAGRQMARFGRGGSIILFASIAGSVGAPDGGMISYGSAKSAVLQVARSMACELGSKKIRVNSLSPGFIRTPMTSKFLDTRSDILDGWVRLSPLGRIGRADEIRGVVTWLASDASSFCTGSK